MNAERVRKLKGPRVSERHAASRQSVGTLCWEIDGERPSKSDEKHEKQNPGSDAEEDSFRFHLRDARGIAELLIIRHETFSCRIARVDGKGGSHLLEGGNARMAMCIWVV